MFIFVRRWHYGFWMFTWDCFLTILTCGLWPVYLIFKALRKIGR